MSWKAEAVKGAQEIYDAWDQDESGYDEEYGAGGVCDSIAEALAGALIAEGVEAFTFHYEQDNHTVVIALMDDRTVEVNIPLTIYERGSYYTYKKVPGVQFKEADITMTDIGGPEVFEELSDQ